MSDTKEPEPWLRGTMTEVASLHRAVLHSLQLATEDIKNCSAGLTDEELYTSPGGVAPVAFHLRHIPGSVDRLLTYAEGRQLSEDQLAAMKAESQASSRESLMVDFTSTLEKAAARVLALQSADLEMTRVVGRKQLQTTVGGLLVHISEHTQRHVGQAVTTAKLLIAQRQAKSGLPA